MEDLIDKLARISDYSISNDERSKTYQMSEDYKLNYFNMSDLDLFLMPGRHVNVQRFGLQCMEFKIKQCWPNTVPEEKCLMKDRLFQLITSLCTGNSLLPASEESILLLPISDVLVHMIKCEWPQNWPSMMSDLLSLSQHGYFQTKLVLASLLRLSQDVMQLDNVPHRRKKEIVSALHENIDYIFNFCLTTMMEQLRLYQATTQDLHASSQALSLCKESILTLTGFLDWVKMEYICQKDGLLFQLLVSLLSPHKESAFSVQSPVGFASPTTKRRNSSEEVLDNNEDLKWTTSPMAVRAIEAILVALCRKEKLDQREALIVLLENEVIFRPLMACTRRLMQMEKPLERVTDMEFEFLSRLCEIFVRLGCLCLQVWPTRYKELPPNWNQLLECILFFTKHPSKMICEEPCEFWLNLYTHSSPVVVAQGNSFVEILHGVWLQNIIKKPCDDLTRRLLEADDYSNFFAKNRGAHLRCLNVVSQAFPNESLQYFFTQARQFIHEIPQACDNDWNHSLLEGEAMILYSESVLRIIPTTRPPSPLLLQHLTIGSQLLQEILSRLTALVSPLLAQNSLSTLQFLPILVDLSRSFLLFAQANLPQLLPAFLNHLFQPMQWKTVELDGMEPRRAALVNLHMNCAVNFVRATQQHRKFFMDYFSQLLECVRSAVMNSEGLGWLQRSMLLQGIVTLSGEFQNFEKQNAVIATLFQPLLVPEWTEGMLATAVLSHNSFFSYLGLNEPANSSSPAMRMEFQGRRNLIMSTLNSLLFCVRSSQTPTDVQTRETGGFVQMVNGQKIVRNPMSPLLMSIMPTLFSMLHCLTILNSDDGCNLVHVSYRESFHLSQHMKLTILGKVPYNPTTTSNGLDTSTLTDNESVTTTAATTANMQCNGNGSNNGHPATRPTATTMSSSSLQNDVILMQKFVVGSFETLCQLLGHTCSVLNEELYMVPNVANLVLLNLAFRYINVLRNYKLHILLKYFLRPLIHHCPPGYYSSVLVPVIPFVISNTFMRVEKHWRIISESATKNSGHNNGEEEEDERDELSDEVIEEHCTRVLTRTGLDIVKLSLLTSSVMREKESEDKEEECGGGTNSSMMDAMENEENSGYASPSHTQSSSSSTSAAQSTDLGVLGRLLCVATVESTHSKLDEDASNSSAALVLLAALAQAITWPDTLVCHRAAPLIIPLLKEMQHTCPHLVSEAVVTRVFHCLLTSFTVNGQHRESALPFLLNAAIQLYETFRPAFPHLSDLLQAATRLGLDKIQAFEKKLFTSAKKMNDRNKRDLFRTLVEALIGVPLSEQFRENVHIKNLPPLVKQKWKPPPNLLDRESTEDGDGEGAGHADVGLFRALFEADV